MMADRPGVETWNEYRRLVIMELESLKQSNVDILDKLDDVRRELTCKIDEKYEMMSNKNHAIDLRLNAIETKMYLISGAIGTVVSIIVAFGKAIIGHYFS
jgi:hypothetical protein